MVSHIILGLNLELGNIKRVKVDISNFESETSEIKELKLEASKQSEISCDILELVHQGQILDEQKTLRDYSVKAGDVIYVLKKYVEPVKEVKPNKSTVTSFDIHNMIIRQGVRRSLSSFISVIEPVFNSSNVEKFLEIAPELEADPVAISFLTAPELLFLLQDHETFAEVSKEHPVLVPAFVKIFKTLLSNGGNSSSLTTHVHQMIESEEEYEDVDLMDPEEYDDEDSDTQGGENLITPEQLSAALAMARAFNSNSSANTSASGPSSSSSSNRDNSLREFLGSLLSGIDSDTSASNSGTPSRPLITRDMFSNALSQAISSVSNTSTSNSNLSSSGEPSGLMPTFTPSDSPTYVPTPSESNYSEQLTKMREMGLTNHQVNLRALIVSNGDVNSAINLVLSGAIDD